MSKKRIAHIQLLPILSGVQKVSVLEIEGLKGFFDFSLVCAGEGPLTQRLNGSLEGIHFVPSLRREYSLMNDLFSLFHLIRVLREEKFDVIHTHSSKTGFLARLASIFVSKTKVVHTVHGFAYPAASNVFTKFLYILLEFIAARFTDELVVMNRQDLNFSIRFLLYRRNRVHLIMNSTEIAQNTIFPKAKRSEHIFTFGFIGRMEVQKNPLLLFSAFKLLRDRGLRNIQLIFVGDGPLLKELSLLLDKFGLGEWVKLFGWKDVPTDHLRDFDVLCLPSLWEGCPLVVIEAMFCGVPIIGSRIPGVIDLLEDDRGLLFESGNVEDLARNMEFLVFNKGALDVYRQMSLEFAMRFLSPDRHLGQLSILYKSLT